MFVKMFSQIFDSSIADDYQMRHIFEDLCKLADIDGVVDMTPEAIAARTRIPLTLVKPALAKLSSPDPRSRSPAEDGRRIILIDSHRDWGWRIVNYEHYRQLRDDDARRSYFRDYMRQYRAKKKADGVLNSKQKLNSVNHSKPQSTHAEAEAEAEEDPNQYTRPSVPGTSMGNAPNPGSARDFEKFWEAYPKKQNRADAERAFVESGAFKDMDLVLAAISAQSVSQQWKREWPRYIPLPANWLRDKRWGDGESDNLQASQAASKISQLTKNTITALNRHESP